MRFLPVQLPGAALPLLAIAVLALASPLAHAQWKWRDRTGQINVSDRPPPLEVPEKDILSRPTPDGARLQPAASVSASAASAPGRATPLDRELEARRRTAEQEKAAKARADEERQIAQRVENCKRARGQLATLESGQRIARANDKGEREVLDDAGRAEEMRVVREVIATDCR